VNRQGNRAKKEYPEYYMLVDKDLKMTYYDFMGKIGGRNKNPQQKF